MKISSINGQLKIDGKEVLTILFRDGSTMRFPNEDTNQIFLETGSPGNEATIYGSKSTAISGKNVIAPGSVIKCGGNFRLGDG